MRSLISESQEWMNVAIEARRTANEKDNKLSEAARQVADLCEHISAAMERIAQIAQETSLCERKNCQELESFKPN